MANIHPDARNSSSTGRSAHQGQTHPVSESTSKPPLLCSECTTACGRIQELQRHMLSAHLPCCLHCPHFPCSWTGHRNEEFKTHLQRAHPGSDPRVNPSSIYDSKMVLDWIKNGTPVETAVGYARDLVSERAHELGFVNEWSDL